MKFFRLSAKRAGGTDSPGWGPQNTEGEASRWCLYSVQGALYTEDELVMLFVHTSAQRASGADSPG